MDTKNIDSYGRSADQKAKDSKAIAWMVGGLAILGIILLVVVPFVF